MNIPFEDWPPPLFKKLPFELWFLIRKMFVVSFLKEHLKFPVLSCKRQNDAFYADRWLAFCGCHKWTIEQGGPFGSSLISQFYKGKRVGFQWSGISMLFNERVFGSGFHVDHVFLDSIFSNDDYWNFEYVYDEESDRDDFLLHFVDYEDVE
jgi:hypothetical protein